MSTYAKKLLSWLCVAAMVFAMVPAVALPASAEETEAPDIEYGSANLPEGIQAITDAAAVIQAADLSAHIQAGTCPICGDGVEWKDATYPNQTTTEGEKRHYYVTDDTQVSPQYNWYAANGKNITMCLALLNTNTSKEIGGLIGLRNQANGCTINIMGSGTITSSGAKTGDGQFGVVCVQGSKNTVNLYGGTFIYTGDGQGRNKIDSNGDGVIDKLDNKYEPSGVIGAGAITLKGGASDSNNVINIFDGVTIGPETQDPTKPCFNVVIQPVKEKQVCTINMYGGTIRNGVSNLGNTSGNVHMHYDSKSAPQAKPTFNMYGGTVTGGTFVEGTTNASGGNFYCGPGAQVNMYAGLVTGGKSLNSGGNFFVVDSGVSKINLLGGVIENGEGQYGGNAYITAKTVIGGTVLIRDGVASKSSGGNIAFRGATNRTMTVEGGKIEGGRAENGGGGNIWSTAKAVTISGGVIDGGYAKFGGNISAAGPLLTITGGTIQNGEAWGAVGGGNIYGTYDDSIEGDEIINITGGVIKDGKASYPNEGTGGNLRINNAKTTIGGNAQILGGDARSMGGSIYVTTGGELVVEGNAVVAGGRSNKDGGSIAIYIGKLTIGGNAQIKDGRATRYEGSIDETTGKKTESFIGDGGNIFVYGYYQTVDNQKVYTNELRIQDNAVISGGWAARGGNLMADTCAVCEIGEGVVIKDGVAGIEENGEMVLSEGVANAGRGGNIYHGASYTMNLAAKLTGGRAYYGANLGQYGGTINFSGIMEDGYSEGFGGNACIQGSKTVLNLNGAEIRNASSGGQGGNLRVYNATVNMNGGKIYGGDDLSKNNSDNVWLVCSTLRMSGDATVVGNTVYGSGVRAVPYNGISSVVSLADTASIIGDGTGMLTVQNNADNTQSQLYIAEGWAGTAQMETTDAYTYGDTIKNDTVVVGSFAEDGTFTKGGTFSGTLLRSAVNVFGVDGDAVMAAAGYIAEDGAKAWFKTNNEAIAAYQHSANAYVLLTGETAEIPETLAEINIRLAGKDVTVSGTATVNGSDAENDDYAGNGKLIPAEGAELTVNPVAIASSKRYIALQGEDGSWTFHRLTMYMDTVTLRTEGNPGIYYKATYKGDEALKELVDSYGVALSLQDMPGTDFETADKFTAYDGADFAAAYKNGTVNTTSGAVVGIMKERNSKATNTANANMPIYANAYLKLNIAGEELLIMADSGNIGKKASDEGFSGTAYSLLDVLDGVNENWDKYSDEEKGTIGAFLEKWAAFITEEAVAQLQTQLDKIFSAA